MPRRHHGDGIWRSGDRLHAHRPEPPVQLEPDPVDVVNDDVVGSTLPPPYHELQPELGDDVNDDVPPYYENASSEAFSDVRTEAAHARAEPPLIPRPPPSYSESRNHPTAPSVSHERRLHTTLPQSGNNQHSGAGPRAVTIADKRSMSVVNPKLAAKIRGKVNADTIVEDADSSCCWMDPSVTRVENTLVLPPFRHFSPAVQSYLYWRLLDVARLERLQKSGAINGLPTSESVAVDHDSQLISIEPPCCKSGDGKLYSALLPMNVMGDGNCLLHACSVALWGIQDRLSTLRTALTQLMTQQREIFFDRWQQQEAANDLEDARTLGLTEAIQRAAVEWEREFDDLIDRSSRDAAFLAEIHIYVLAHVLRRPIIVFADSIQQDSPCRFRGIYLPLEWMYMDMACETAPLLLAYDGLHFVPLVYHLDKPASEEQDISAWPLIPLSCASRGTGAAEPLPLKFTGRLIGPGPTLEWATSMPTRYAEDAVAALRDILPMEPMAVPMTTAPGPPPGGGCEAGVRMNLLELRGRRQDGHADESGGGVSADMSQIVDGWLNELRVQAVEASSCAHDSSARETQRPLLRSQGLRQTNLSMIRSDSLVGRNLRAMRQEDIEGERSQFQRHSGHFAWR